MIYRGILIKYALKFSIVMTAVLAGLFNLSIVSLLSHNTGLSERQAGVETAAPVNVRFNEREKNLPEEEPRSDPDKKPPDFISGTVIQGLYPEKIRLHIPEPVIKTFKIKTVTPDLPRFRPVTGLSGNNHFSFRRIRASHCFYMDEVDVIPRAVSAVQPLYPFRARRLSLSGYVAVRFLVDTNGDVLKLIIADSSPEGVFEQSVKNTVFKWKFKPGMKNGIPVRTWMSKTIEFVHDKNS